MNYFIVTFGCQLNRSDSERIASVLEKIGYKKSSDIESADLILVNMCSVRQSAVDRVYGLLNQKSKAKNQNYKSKCKIILTGCILKEDKKKLKNKADFILDIKDLPKLPKILNTKYSILNAPDYLKIKPKYESPFSALIPIMTGCNNYCSYCAVPYTRGREISRPAKEIILEIKSLVKKGFKEIWLLGQNVNSYHSRIRTNLPQISRIKNKKSSDISGKFVQISDVNFAKLLKMVNKIPGNFWIRFTSPHPKDFSDELINVMAEGGKITEYLNLPVQSGDDEVLKKMNRPYKISQYKSIIRKIRKKIPGIALSTDIIVGFPGETKKQFENTAKLFKEIKYDMAYINKYSPRSGTVAAKLKDNVSLEEKKRRYEVLTEILKKTALENNKKYLEKEVEILVDSKKDNVYFGKTRTYKTVKIKSSKNLIGKFVKAKIISALAWGLEGNLI